MIQACLLTGACYPGRRLDSRSRMSGDVHVRFCEHVGVRFPCVTRLVVLIDGHPRQRGLRSVVEQRLRRELAKL